MSEEEKPDVLDELGNALFVRNKVTLEMNITIRRVLRWWFELIRNFLVVAGLYYLAEKSDSLALKTVAYVSAFALFAYIQTLVSGWWIHPFPFIKNKAVNRDLNSIAALILGLSIGGGCMALFFYVFQALKILAK